MRNEVTTQKAADAAARKLRMKLAFNKAAIACCCFAMIASNAMITAFADNAENAKPENVGGATTMKALVTVVFWIIRVAILIIGGGPALLKIVQGQADENPRDRNAGIATAVITGAVFGASFLIEKLI